MKKQTDEQLRALMEEIVGVARSEVNQMRLDVDAAIAAMLDEHQRWQRRPLIQTPDGIPDGWHVRVEDGVPVLGRNA